MLRLLTLGGLSLTDEEGAQAHRVLRRPKWVAFLCVLATSPGWVARETLMALLWPDLDDAHARHALRQTLSEVNAALPPGTLLSETGAGLMTAADRLWCDAAQVHAAARAGRHGDVHELYRGEFLPGFNGAIQSRAFEEWIDRQRRSLRAHAFRSTWELAVAAEASGEPVRACQLAVQVSELQPYDEAVLRRAIALLVRLGDRARAYGLFRDFRDRLQADLEMEPSRETLTLAEKIRAGGGATA